MKVDEEHIANVLQWLSTECDGCCRQEPCYGGMAAASRDVVLALVARIRELEAKLGHDDREFELMRVSRNRSHIKNNALRVLLSEACELAIRMAGVKATIADFERVAAIKAEATKP